MVDKYGVKMFEILWIEYKQYTPINKDGQNENLTNSFLVIERYVQI